MMVGVIMAIGIILWVLRGKRRTEIEREERVVDAIFRMERGLHE
jgi:cbb3-type cytochrome oxidase subunit 3